MGVQITTTVTRSVRIREVKAVLKTLVPLSDPVQFVVDNEDGSYDEIISRAGLPDTTIFVSIVLKSQGNIGDLLFYALLLTLDQSMSVATAHEHGPETLFHPLQAAYEDGPRIDLATTLGPVQIRSAKDAVDYFEITDTENDQLIFGVNKEATLTIGGHVGFEDDTAYDIGTYNGVQFYRPRDVYIGRDLWVARDGYFSVSTKSPEYKFFEQVANPDDDPATRHLYWNDTDNRLHAWDGTTDYSIGGSGSIPFWDDIYAVDKLLEINSTALTFTHTGPSTGFLLQRTSGTPTGPLMYIDNSAASDTEESLVVRKTGTGLITDFLGSGGTSRFSVDAAGKTSIITSSSSATEVLSLLQGDAGKPLLRLVGDKGPGATVTISEDSEPAAVMLRVEAGTTSGQSVYWMPAYSSTVIPAPPVGAHALDPSSGPHTGTLAISGDVTGAHTTTTVTKLQSRTVDSSAPSIGEVLGWDGSKWTPQAGGGGGGNVIGTYTGTAVIVGNAVYVSTSDTVNKSNATGAIGRVPTIGICIEKPDVDTAKVQLAGEISGVLSGLTPGATYFLDRVSGQITNNISSHTTGDTLQIIGVAKSTTVLVLTQQIIATL